MKLKELLKDVEYEGINELIGLDISGISINSKTVKQGDLFVATAGFKKDGHDFAAESVKNGAVAVLVQKKLDLPTSTAQIVVKDCRKVLPLVSRNFFGNPTKILNLIGVTGTNGKTTSVFLIDSMLKYAGYKTSKITTVQASINDEIMIFERTTPESIDLNQFFYRSIKEGVNAACMEVSSHSIDLHRIDFLDFNCFVFTNLTQDHLDYHKNMENYFEVKKRLFLKENRRIYGGKYAVINIDDPYGMELVKFTDLEVLTYAINNHNADVSAVAVKNSINGIEMDIKFKNKAVFHIKSKLCGYFNVYNIIASVGACLKIGINVSDIQAGIDMMTGVSGRFEKVDLKNNVNVIVDYAHTPDGLEKVLSTAKSLLLPGGRLISVFGCGGDRDKQKRKIMGKISAEIADFTIITSDNPRTEEPESIIKMIEEGFLELHCVEYVKEIDRKKAIYKALNMATSKDIVLIAGKGHEEYQEFANYRIHFVDQEVVREWGIK